MSTFYFWDPCHGCLRWHLNLNCKVMRVSINGYRPQRECSLQFSRNIPTTRPPAQVSHPQLCPMTGVLVTSSAAALCRGEQDELPHWPAVWLRVLHMPTGKMITSLKCLLEGLEILHIKGLARCFTRSRGLTRTVNVSVNFSFKIQSSGRLHRFPAQITPHLLRKGLPLSVTEGKL